MSGFLALEDGTVFRGESVAAEGFAVGEAVFTTAMTGYQEIVTDPSFAEQLVCFTAPMVGNYGVAEGRSESARVHARAVLMREARGPAWTDWLHERGVVALTGIDTRSLVLKLREAGALRAVAVAGEGSVEQAASVARAQVPMSGRALAAEVSTVRPYVYADAGRARIAVVDYGCKRSIPHPRAGGGAAAVRRHRALEWAGRPGATCRGGRGRPRAHRPRPDSRHLPGAPASRPCGRTRDVQAPVRPPRREPSRARARERACARDEPEPWLRGCTIGGARGDARLALRRHRRGARPPARTCAIGAVPSRGRPRAP